MKFGLMLSTQYPRRTRVADYVEGLVEQVRLAQDLGFSSIWTLQHYAANLDTLQPLQVLARMIPESGNMSLGTNIFVLPLHHPVVAAEQFATLDQLSNGRAIAGVGMGYRRTEAQALGVELSERVGRLSESISIMRKLWRDEPVQHVGRYYTLDDVSIGLLPVQDGGPPIWIGAEADAAVARAARLGDEVIMLQVLKASRIERLLELYRSAREEAGRPPSQEYPIFREVCIRDTREAAQDTARPYLAAEAQAYAKYGVEFLLERLEELMQGAYLLCDSAECISRIHVLEDLGMNHLIIRVQWCGMNQREAMLSLERFGREVMPAFSRESVGP